MSSKLAIMRIWQYIKPHIAQVVLGFVSAIAAVLLMLLGPVFIGEAIDSVIGVGNVEFSRIAYYLMLYLLSTLLAFGANWLMNVCTRKVSAYAARDMRLEAFKGSNGASLLTLDNFSAGDTVSRMVNDADLVGEGILQGLTQLLPGICTIIGTVVVMLWQSPPIAVLVVVITPVSILFAAVLAKKTSNLFKQQATMQGQLSGYISESVNSSDVIRAFGYEQRAYENFEKINSQLAKTAKKSVFLSSISNPGTRFVNSIVYASVCVVGAVFAVNGSITIGQLSMFLNYANQYTKPFNEVSGVLTQLQSAIAAAQRLIVLIDLKPEALNDTSSAPVIECKGDVALENVSFSYTPENPLITGINLEARHGQRIAIVGPTGCGKTTLINLLMRFYETSGGTISVDNTNIKEISRNSLRSLYGMVLQETWLKNATVSENIAYGKPDATEHEIIDAAKTAHAHSFIKRLPEGYNTQIAAGGSNLSAGQRQLLCIARIMLTRPEMLILDEATSSIDTRTEMRVQKAFATLMQGRTSFVVAHRLSTIQSADCILVMKSGQIVERGTHEQLLAQHGFYESLYKSQFTTA